MDEASFCRLGGAASGEEVEDGGGGDGRGLQRALIEARLGRANDWSKVIK